MPCSAIRPRRAKAVVIFRLGRNQPHVAVQRLDQADPRAGTVDRRDQRLANREWEGLRPFQCAVLVLLRAQLVEDFHIGIPGPRR